MLAVCKELAVFTVFMRVCDDADMRKDGLVVNWKAAGWKEGQPGRQLTGND